MAEELIHDAQRLKELQALPLERKIMITQARIMEFYNKLDGKVYVSFSGGKDSTVLAHIVQQMYPDVPLVFINTGLEYPEIQKFAKSKGAVFVYPKKNFREVLTEYGYPIISKEVSEAIYYARRIRGGQTHSEHEMFSSSIRFTNHSDTKQHGTRNWGGETLRRRSDLEGMRGVQGFTERERNITEKSRLQRSVADPF